MIFGRQFHMTSDLELSPSQLEDLGSAVSSPIGVRDGASATTDFDAF